MDQESWKPRELEILQLLAQGLTNSEVASRLHLSQETVRWYNKQIFEKLGASNRTQAVQKAAEQNLLKDALKVKGPEGSGGAKKPITGAVRYISNGGIHIAYKIIGEGPVDVLFIHGFISNLEIAFEDPEYSAFFDTLGKFSRVIVFDKRGMGLSDRVQGAPSLEDTMSDALCVLDAAASNRTFVMGTSEGGSASVLLASTYPERVRGLILYSSTPKLVKSNGEPEWADDEDRFENSLEAIRAQWGGPWGLQNFAPSRAQNEVFRNWWSKVLRSSTSPSEASSVLRVLRDIDIRPLLPQVRTRTLILHKVHDRIVDVGASRYFAAHMPNAKYVELPGADHFFFIESGRLVAEVGAFLREEPEALADTWIGIVMVLKTSRLDQNEKNIQLELKEARAKGFFFMGDEVIATFDSPSRAIQCALKLRDVLRNQPTLVSLHVGECNLDNHKPTHAVIETARRAVEAAPDDKVIVTQTLRDILAGSGVVFDLRKIQFNAPRADSLSLYTLS